MDELDLSPEELDALMQLGIYPDQLEDIGRQEDDYRDIMFGAGPEGRDAGRVYVAANPLEHIGGLMQKYQAKKQLKGLGDQREEIYGNQGRARGMYWNLLRGKGQMSPLAPDQTDRSVDVQGPDSLPEHPIMGEGHDFRSMPASPQPAQPPSIPAVPAPAGGKFRGGRRRPKTREELEQMAMLLRGFG